jgi:hypothetical protein
MIFVSDMNTTEFLPYLTEFPWFGLFAGPSGDLKFKKGVDANGRVPKVSCE